MSTRALTIKENNWFADKERASYLAQNSRGGWTIHDSGLADYSRTFEQVSQPGFRRSLLKVVEQGGQRSILDLMASEYAVREAVDLGFSYGLAVSLGYENQGDNSVNGGKVDVLNGDILSYRTWGEIEGRMKHEGFSSGFDVIVSRPEGGLHCITDSEFVHYWLLHHAWKLLSPDDGQLYLQAPTLHWMNSTLYYLKALKKCCGISVRWDEELDAAYGYALYMQKKPYDPNILPSAKALGL